MDLTQFTDEELRNHLNAVIAEQERRRRLEFVPGQFAAMAAQYVADGGDRETIIEAVTNAKQQTLAPDADTFEGEAPAEEPVDEPTA